VGTALCTGRGAADKIITLNRAGFQGCPIAISVCRRGPSRPAATWQGPTRNPHPALSGSARQQEAFPCRLLSSACSYDRRV